MVDMEDDLAGLSGLHLKGAAEDVIGTLGLDPRDAEVVDLRAVDLSLDAKDGEGSDEPDAEDPVGVAGAALAESIEER
jgi:hypothetical protein